MTGTEKQEKPEINVVFPVFCGIHNKYKDTFLKISWKIQFFI